MNFGNHAQTSFFIHYLLLGRKKCRSFKLITLINLNPSLRIFDTLRSLPLYPSNVIRSISYFHLHSFSIIRRPTRGVVSEGDPEMRLVGARTVRMPLSHCQKNVQ